MPKNLDENRNTSEGEGGNSGSGEGNNSGNGGKSESESDEADEDDQESDDEDDKSKKKDDKGEEKKFSQSDVDKIVKERLEREKKRADRDAQRRADEESGNWKKLYEAEKADHEKLKTELADEKLKSARATSGANHKLPASLIERLKGSTPEEIEADAKALAKTLGTSSRTNLEGGEKRNGKGTQKEVEDAARSRARSSGRYPL